MSIKTKQSIRQTGSISVLGILTVLSGLTGFLMILELSDKMTQQSVLENHATAVAPVAIRAEIAIRQDSDDPQRAIKEVDQLLNQLGYNQIPEEGEDKAINVSLTFGNIEGQGDNARFTPLSMNASNPRGLANNMDDIVEFSAVAVELTYQQSSFIGEFDWFKPKGRTIYGLSEKQKEDIGGGCFCQSRYNACLAAEPEVGYETIMGQKETDTVEADAVRKNYCEYGYMPTKSSSTTEKKYLNFDVPDKWLGSTDVSEVEMVNYQSPVSVSSSNFFMCPCMPSGGITHKNYNGTTVYTLGCCFMPKAEKVSGDFYVGRVGMCIANTNNTNVANLSAFYSDKSTIPQDSVNDSKVTRCLSYLENNRYLQQSCVEQQRETKVSFLQWMIMSFTWPFISWERSYQDVDCVTRNMRWYGSFIWGDWY
ncbi:hypothetical protein [Thiomicrospira pelophila]|uniref:hypothetical protein n=1 Tax=Thiomicrospira pelophila TaxID=934 RepID=UPI0004A73831|nr:hypothetical protein [Thiomicrospira pelophila]